MIVSGQGYKKGNELQAFAVYFRSTSCELTANYKISIQQETEKKKRTGSVFRPKLIQKSAIRQKGREL
jgi:hypothetical protein